MYEVRVSFKSVEDIQEFHNIISKFDADVDAIKGTYIVDAKSFMGLMTIDYSTPVIIKINSSDLSLRKKIEKWIVK